MIILAPPNYFRGYTNVIPLLGSPWTNPPPSIPAIPLNDGILEISGNGIAATVTYTVTVNTNNMLITSGAIPANSFRGAIDPKTGGLTIIFGNGSGDLTRVGAGAVLQNAVCAGGFSASFDQLDCSITLHP